MRILHSVGVALATPRNATKIAPTLFCIIPMLFNRCSLLDYL